MKEKLFAVITGDVAGSSRFTGDDRVKLLNALKTAFSNIEKILGDEVVAFPFEIFRGDSFQGVLGHPEQALTAGLIIRATTRSLFRLPVKDAVDARIAVGVGTISLMPGKSSGEGDGEAYRNSGPELDRLAKASRMLTIKTPHQEINRELDVECALLDAILGRWTPQQAEVALEFFGGATQEQIAVKFDVSQPAARKRMQAANLYQLELMMKRYTQLYSKL